LVQAHHGPPLWKPDFDSHQFLKMKIGGSGGQRWFFVCQMPFAGAGEFTHAFSELGATQLALEKKDSPAGNSDSAGFAFSSCSRANFVHSAANSSQPSLKGLTVIRAIWWHISACAR
jgi:hypothetical protein